MQSVYAPFHRLSGVQYHALSLCVGGKTWCSAGSAGKGGAKLPFAYKKQKFSDMQLSGPLLARLSAILDAPDGDVARASRLAPYALRLRCAEPVGTPNPSPNPNLTLTLTQTEP